MFMNNKETDVAHSPCTLVPYDENIYTANVSLFYSTVENEKIRCNRVEVQT